MRQKTEKKQDNPVLKQLIAQNEASANLVISGIIFALSAAVFLVALLAALGMIHGNSIRIMLFVSAVILFACAAAVRMHKGQGRWIKFMAIVIMLLLIFLINVMGGYKSRLLYAVPLILTCRYYNIRFTAFGGIFAAVLTFVSAFCNVYVSPRLGLIDLNTIGYLDGEDLKAVGTLYSSVIEHGFDEKTVLMNTFRLDTITDLLFIFFITAACIALVLHAQSLILQERETAERNAQLLSITEQQRVELQDTLDRYHQADSDRRTDFLTGLHNRLDLFDMLRRVLSGKHEPIQAMFMMDIDNFKKLNDTLGHSYGDECLRTIGTALLKYGEENGMEFYRYGGEEMLGLSFLEEKSAENIADELVSLVSGLGIQRADSPRGVVTISLGYTENNSRYEKMIDMADKAMYCAKARGKDQSVCYEEMLRNESKDGGQGI